jgi:hypothetical protein
MRHRFVHEFEDDPPHRGSRPGYHFHRSYDWKESPGAGQEVFELSDGNRPINLAGR